MCLYPKLIRNKKYLPTKTNNFNPPRIKDPRTAYITAACGKCLECRKQKQRAWMVRMSEELRENPNAYFMTLTMSDEEYEKLKNEYDLKDDNDIATKAIRLMLERVRKKLGHSIKHWFITEKGHENTKRIHLHGIVWGIGNDKIVEEKWNYGIVWTGKFVNERTINYITKYMTKVDADNKDFIGKVLCSKGLGAGYTKRFDAGRNRFKGEDTEETYRTRSGMKVNLPIYYRNKIYTEEQRELLFIQKIEKGIIYVMGQPVRADDEELYIKLLEQGRKQEARLNGKTGEDWEREAYLQRLRKQRKKQEKAMKELTKHWETTRYDIDAYCPF